MTRMIERWFPCAEVSAAAGPPWGRGKSEKSLFVWFAARPTAQAKAAEIWSLLPWPDDESEQKRVQELVSPAPQQQSTRLRRSGIDVVIHLVTRCFILIPRTPRSRTPFAARSSGESTP